MDDVLLSIIARDIKQCQRKLRMLTNLRTSQIINILQFLTLKSILELMAS